MNGIIDELLSAIALIDRQRVTFLAHPDDADEAREWIERGMHGVGPWRLEVSEAIDRGKVVRLASAAEVDALFAEREVVFG